MMKRILAVFVLAAIALAIVGIVLPLSHHSAHSACPFMTLTSDICDGAFVHLEHWQSTFTGVFSALVLFIALIVVVVRVQEKSPEPPDRSRTSSVHIPVVPLFQLLASRGILHPKAP